MWLAAIPPGTLPAVSLAPSPLYVPSPGTAPCQVEIKVSLSSRRTTFRSDIYIKTRKVFMCCHSFSLWREEVKKKQNKRQHLAFCSFRLICHVNIFVNFTLHTICVTTSDTSHNKRHQQNMIPFSFWQEEHRQTEP